MATIHNHEDVQGEEVSQEIEIDSGRNVIYLTEPDQEDQQMEIDGGDDDAESQGIQPSDGENIVPENREGQLSMSNSTPVVVRSVQVLGVSAVNSPDEFQNKASKPSSKNTSKVKSPIKSPQKDDDVSLSFFSFLSALLNSSVTLVVRKVTHPPAVHMYMYCS